jgi:hypothetical protein
MMAEPVPIFHGRVTPDGELVPFTSERTQRKAYLRILAGTPIVEIIVRKPADPRTLDMNAYLHAVVFPMVAEEMGQGIEETKRDLMGACWGWRDERRKIPMRRHTSKMTQAESKFFLDWVIPFAQAQFNGLQIPYPGEAEA